MVQIDWAPNNEPSTSSFIAAPTVDFFETPPIEHISLVETRTKSSSFSATLDRIDENFSLNQFTSAINQLYKSSNVYGRKQSLDPALLLNNECSYYNKYFDCCQSNGRRDFRRYSEPPTPTMGETMHLLKAYQRKNLVLDAFAPTASDVIVVGKKSVALCFTPSQERAYENVKMCFKCGHTRSNC